MRATDDEFLSEMPKSCLAASLRLRWIPCKQTPHKVCVCPRPHTLSLLKLTGTRSRMSTTNRNEWKKKSRKEATNRQNRRKWEGIQPTTFIESDIETGHGFSRDGRRRARLIGALDATRSGWWRWSQPPRRTVTGRAHAEILLLLLLVLHLLVILLVLMRTVSGTGARAGRWARIQTVDIGVSGPTVRGMSYSGTTQKREACTKAAKQKNNINTSKQIEHAIN